MTRPDCPKCGKQMRSGGKREGKGAQRWRCATQVNGQIIECYSTTNPSVPTRGPDSKSVEKVVIPRRTLADTKRFIITSAQNGTPVHEKFWATLKVYAKHNGAELIVIPLRYKNPTSHWSASQQGAEHWATEVRPYLYDQRKKLNPNLVLVGDVKIQPTAVNPLTGFEGLTHGESCILGHTKIQVKAVAAPANRYPKILATTGSCTVRNYTDSRAGKLGEFHHSLAAAVVEVDGKTFHLRQVCAASDGSFTDLDHTYDDAGVRPAAAALGLILGDWHQRFTAAGVEQATFGRGGMVECLNPVNLVWHDLLDGHTVNPYHRGNPFIAAAKEAGNATNVRDEVLAAVQYVDEHTVGRNSYIVSSNHDDFLRRWVIDNDVRSVSGADNKRFWAENFLIMLDSAHMNRGGAKYAGPFKHWVGELSKNPGVKALDPDESLLIGRFQCGSHGNKGPNGSRGSLANLSRLGSLVISGHGHTMGWQEGHRRVGTATGRQEYEEGPSSHTNTHCVVYASGASSLLTIIGDKWKL